MKSIVQREKECFFCKSTINLEKHHIFGGTANRKISEKYGLTVYLCHEHHTGDSGVHFDIAKMNYLHRIGQIIFEGKFGHDLFMKEIGRNYL